MVIDEAIVSIDRIGKWQTDSNKYLAICYKPSNLFLFIIQSDKFIYLDSYPG